MMINQDVKEKIGSLNPIKEVVQEVIPLKGNVDKCPKHNDENSFFSVDADRGIF